MHQNLVEYSWGPGLIISIDSTIVFDSMSICLYVRKYLFICEKIKGWARGWAKFRSRVWSKKLCKTSCARTHKLRYALSLSLYIHTFCANIIFYCGTFRLLYCSVSVKQQMLSWNLWISSAHPCSYSVFSGVDFVLEDILPALSTLREHVSTCLCSASDRGPAKRGERNPVYAFQRMLMKMVACLWLNELNVFYFVPHTGFALGEFWTLLNRN